ncbi:tRNA dihydrouridine synthase DusB [Alkalitalea saponilacus]|uniref:tRNA-dihydrouridine synthase n=1 Tax=Alkalitalea saponilacus TaxID=889453 RepID=A0A1T5HTM8_9BACT|nr:tRNA dihydrouridine synthase DusB [Alkalitalea saponilacus]ASB49297.1 tRNA dihydrouridine synthase DusB [Alkalitalea saponilacus]SKC24047.1 putative TIM-barrel protein, nifR3 family [Alkalitalea saponilacus]
MKIGELELRKEPLLLAPMEDVTDHMFRSLCKQYGVDLMYTEFVSSDALVRDVEKTKRKLTILEEERPVGIQLYGKDPDALAEAARIAEAANPELIDLNFGCPVKKIATKGAGSGMLRDIPLMLKITKAVVNAVKLPVTVKTRLGWDHDSKIIAEIAEPLQDTGIKALAIHGRTRSQLYTGEADWTLIGEVKNNPRIHIPIIGNGDVDSPEKARLYFDRYGVDAIMIGRPSIGRPRIFKEIRHYLDTGVLLPPITMDEHVEMIREVLHKAVDHLGERRGILHSRRHLAVTFKGLQNFRSTKIQMLRSESVAEIDEILNGIKTDYAGFTPGDLQGSSDVQ